jgi:arylsulfatase
MLILLLACSAPADLPPPPAEQGAPAAQDSAADGGAGGDETGGGGDTGPAPDSAAPGPAETGAAETGTPDTEAPAESPLEWSGERPKNVLMIVLDTARPDWFSRYDARAATPNIDALLAGSVVLEGHRSCSNWTWPSVLCAQASLSELEAGFITDGAALGEVPPASLRMAEEVLAEAGYYTASLSSNSFFSAATGTAVGFERQLEAYGWAAGEVTALAMELLTEVHNGVDRPWYLHLHYFDPHTPYRPPDAYLEGLSALDPIDFDLDLDATFAQLNDAWPSLDRATQALILEHMALRYAAELTYFDDQLGALLAHAEGLGMLDDTLVVFWTDHGEQLFENGSWGHNQLFDVENRAVAAFSAPHLIPMDWAGPTTHEDLWPTALDMLGLPEEPGFRGLQLGQRPADSPLFALRYLRSETQQTVVLGDKKLYYFWTGEKALYTLEADPGEQHNLYSPADPDAAALWDLLLPQVEAVLALKPDYEPSDPGL